MCENSCFRRVSPLFLRIGIPTERPCSELIHRCMGGRDRNNRVHSHSHTSDRECHERRAIFLLILLLNITLHYNLCCILGSLDCEKWLFNVELQWKKEVTVIISEVNFVSEVLETRNNINISARTLLTSLHTKAI